jgi:hypothetical protein
VWVFSKIGFFSAVAAIKKGRPDPSRVCVRARVRRHLVNLCERFGLDRSIIGSSDRSDYRYRILVPARLWAAMTWTLAGEIEYTNFKDAVLQAGDAAYEEALHRVWSAMYGVQANDPETPRPGPTVQRVDLFPADFYGPDLKESDDR